MRHLFHRIAKYELLLLAAATPFLLFPSMWTSVGLALLAVAWVARWVAMSRMSAKTAMDVPIILLLMMTGVSLFPSVDLSLSLNRACLMLLGVALFYGIVNGVHTARQTHYIGLALVLLGLSMAVIGLLGTDWKIGLLVDMPAVYQRLPGPMIRGLPGSGVIEEYDLVNPRVVAGALAIVIPVPLAYLAFGQGNNFRLLSGCTALAMAAVLLLTQAPQGYLGLAAALFLIGVWWSRWMLVALPLSTCGLVGAWGLLRPQQVLVDRLGVETMGTIDFGLRSRIVNGARGLGMVRDMPFTGIGLNTFPAVDGLYSFGRSHAEHAHNLYIQTAVDLGVLGLVALLALLAAFAYTVARAYRAQMSRNQRALLIGACGVVVAWLAYGLLDSITLGHKPGAAVWISLGLAATSRLRLEEAATPALPFPPRLSRQWLLLVLIPLVVLVMIVGLTAKKSVGAFWVNLGVMEAHRALANADSPASVAEHRDVSEEYLREAIRWDPSRARAHRLLEWTMSEDIGSKRWPRETL